MRTAIDVDDSSQKFITTEPLGKTGESAESMVWDAIRNAFRERECIAYWRYPIFCKNGENRKEPDIFIVDRNLGLITIEVKGILINQITSINGHQWTIEDLYDYSYNNPYEQAENQLWAIINHCNNEPAIRNKISGRSLVALPLIAEDQWLQKGFDRLPSCPPIIFKNNLSESSLFNKILETNPVIHGARLEEEKWELLVSVISGSTVLRKAPRAISAKNKTKSSIIASLRDRLYKFDLKQEHIGKSIPPGPQRIRGIAGSGKTVLICQKAAHMHLKHPEWNIAVVFFTQSLYDQIYKQIDAWMRRFTNGQIQFDHNSSNLKVFHAWGGKSRPGFYSSICNMVGERPLTARDLQGMGSPNENLAQACKVLLEKRQIQPVFDAVLIDEGQDLIVKDEYKFEDKQPFYWMAYQALKPVNSAQPEQRRLIWAYDEAQSLYSLKIPQAKELFGNDLSGIVSGQYLGGIKKSEIMTRCYRTPASILTASHGIGMGLLRPEGMLQGFTTQKDWNSIGYDVLEGSFNPPGQKIILHRPRENSLNPVEEMWGKSVLSFETYNSRQEELSALSNDIRYNIENEGLNLSRDILVIVLTKSDRDTSLQGYVAKFLRDKGINFYIPGALDINVPKKQGQTTPNIFWKEDAISVSRIHQAKGNEAEMVYVVGLDSIAGDESNINLRNQLFVAMTRSRGWAKVSGIGDYAMYNEMRNVISSGSTFEFTFKRPPKLDIGEKEEILIDKSQTTFLSF